MWRPAAIGTLAIVLLAAAATNSRAQDRTPQPPAPHPAASDILTAELAQSILGTSVEARGVTPLQCWYVQIGYFAPSGKNKSVRLALRYHDEPEAVDYLAKQELYAEFPSQGATVTELHDFADAAIWIWKPSAGGTLFAFRGGTVQVEVTLSGLAEDASLAHAKSLATQALGGSEKSGYAYLGTPAGDAAAAALDAGPAAPDTPPATAGAATTQVAPTEPPVDTQADAPAAIPDALTHLGDATYLTQAEFLGELKQVSLSLDVPPDVEDLVSREAARTAVVEALAAYGIEVVPQASVLLEVKLRCVRTEREWEGEIRHTYEFLLSLDFVTLVVVRRGGVFHGLYAAVAGDRGQTSVWEANEFRRLLYGDELTPEIHEQLPILARSVLSFIAANTNVDEAPWYAEGWSDEEQAAAGAPLAAALVGPAPTEKRLAGIDSAPAYVLHQPFDDEYCYASPQWGQTWSASFKELGWEREAASAECPLMLLHIFRCEYIDVINTPEYYRMMNIMQLKESNAVFALNGRLVRKPVALMSWFLLDAVFDDEDMGRMLLFLQIDIEGALDTMKASSQ